MAIIDFRFEWQPIARTKACAPRHAPVSLGDGVVDDDGVPVMPSVLDEEGDEEDDDDVVPVSDGVGVGVAESEAVAVDVAVEAAVLDAVAV